MYMGFPGGAVVKNPPANAREVGLISGSGRSPGVGNGNKLQYSCLEKSHEQRNQVGYSPWGQKESDMTESLSKVHIYVCVCVCVCVWGLP